VVGTSIGRDIFEKSLKIKGNPVIVTRIGIVISILFSAFLAWLGNQLKTDIGLIAQATTVFFGLCATAFLPSYIGALYFRRVSRQAAIWSIVSGFATSFIWIFFIHGKNASTIGLCQALFGKAHLLAGTGLASLAQVDSVMITFPLSMIIFVVAALLTRKSVDKSHVDKCFAGI
jgi:SSS family solute:Na+ symporter